MYLMICVLLISIKIEAVKVTWNLKTKYGITQTGFASIIAEAKTRLQSTPNDTIYVIIDQGKFNIGGNASYGILIDNLGTINSKGRLIFKGAGMDLTTLVFTDINQDIMHGSNVYGLQFKNMHMTRPNYTVTQGTVFAVSAGQIDLDIHKDFPTPLAIWDFWEQGRYLRKYTSSKTDPQLIQSDNEQVPWGYRSSSYKQPEFISGHWRIYLNNPTLVLSNYKVGDLVGVKSKHVGNTYWFSTGKDLLFENIKWTHSSRGLVRNGFSNVTLKGCRIERGPALNGQTPCLSTPSGGPQFNQYSSSGDPVATGIKVENCFTESTGDDAVAFFNVDGATITNSTFRNAFGSGIMVSQEAFNICVTGTTIPNSVFELEDRAPNLRAPLTTSDLNLAYSAGYISNCTAQAASKLTDNSEIKSKESILINLTSSNLDIQMNEKGNALIEIYNLQGEVVFSGINKTTFDISNLHKGMYIVSIKHNGQNYIKKIIR